MDRDDAFTTVCHMLNKVLEHQNGERAALTFTENETKHLVAALDYYRSTVDRSSGDVLIRTEYTCPKCASHQTFRAQERHVTNEAEHDDIGVQVRRVSGIAQCGECMVQVRLNQFEAIQLDGFDEAAWDDLFETEYRRREVVTEFQPE